MLELDGGDDCGCLVLFCFGLLRRDSSVVAAMVWLNVDGVLMAGFEYGVWVCLGV